MNENKRLEDEINDQIGMLEQFNHPVVSDDLMKNISRSMSATYRKGRARRILFRIAAPLAAAAVLVLSASIFLTQAKKTSPVRTGTSEIVSIWSLGGEETANVIFADLDFAATTSQPTVKTAASDDTVDQLNQALLEVMNMS